MGPTAKWLLSREALLAVCVGLVGPLLWTALESQLAYYVHYPLSQWLLGEPPESKTAYLWFWRGNQLVYGLLSAMLFAVPLSLAFRANRIGYGVLFVATFLISLVGGTLISGGGEHIPLLFTLPDTWAVLIGSLASFWLMDRKLGGLPSNNTFEGDARESGARLKPNVKRRRWD